MIQIRNKYGRFIKTPDRNTPCLNCGTIIDLKKNIDGKFCKHSCYVEFRVKNDLIPHSIPIACREAQKKGGWRENNSFKKKHSIATSLAMQRPEVQAKIHSKRKPQTEERRKEKSLSMVGIRPKNFTTHVKTNQGWIEFPNGRFYMLSSWERNYARYLQFLVEHQQIKSWEYEPQKFIFEKINFGKRSYLPDFRITENNGLQYYVEVKGWMDPGSRVKLNRMYKYYPDIKIRLIQRKEYEVLKRQFKQILKGWE